jgi:Heterokaryon incompatibility protein (HET)
VAHYESGIRGNAPTTTASSQCMQMGPSARREMNARKSTTILSYRYRSLTMEVGRTEICLLGLLPALASGKPIQCKIHDSFREDILTYSAISYCWGDTDETVPIYIGDCEIRVTINLKDALQHLRHTDTSRFLWADALCIN